MTARVSAEYIDVLGKKSGNARVTQFYIEVLSDDPNVYEQSVSDPISFTDAGAAITNRLAPASSALSLTDVAAGQLISNRSLSDTVTITDVAAATSVLARSVSSSLGITDDAVAEFVAGSIDVDASNDLGITDQASQNVIWDRSVSSLLDLSDTLVLLAVWSKSGSSALGLTDTASQTRIHNVSASSVLTLTDATFRIKEAVAEDVIEFNFEALPEGQYVLAVSSVLSLNDMALPGLISESTSNVMALTQSVHLSDTFPESISDTLAFTQDTLPGLIVIATANIMDLQTTELYGDLNTELRRAASSFLNFAQDAVVGNFEYNRSLPTTIEVVPGNKYLNLTQTVSFTGPKYLAVTSSLTLTDHASITGNVYNQSASSNLSFSQKVGRVFTQSASNLINFTHKGERRFYLASVLNFSDLLSGGVSRGASSVLNFVSTVSLHADFSRSFSHNLGLNHAVTYHIPSKESECTYSPFLGTGSAMPATQPALSTGTLTLVYNATTLVLRNPDFNNQNVYSSDRVNRTTRGGTITIFADPKWPKQQSLKLQISSLSELQVTNFLSFLEQSLGQEITLTDWEGRTWIGIVTTPDAQITRGKGCTNKLGFEFEGELQ